MLVREFFLYRAGENGRKFHTFYDGINFYLNTQQEQQKYISTAIQVLFEEYLLNTDQTDVHENSYPHCGTRKGRWLFMEPPPRVFDMLQYLEAILPSVESR